MTTRATEIAAMQRAVVISAFGLGSASPNPPVGCVILDRDGAPVGEGYHRRKGESHAEVNALAAAGSKAAAGTAVVTLEPCNHHGRTPPCHQALLDAGIARVVIALIDPTSRGEGGAARLTDAGVEIEVGLLADEALVVLGPWLAATRSGRPHVHWACESGPEGFRSSNDLLLWSGLGIGTDAVLHSSGDVEEGIPGAHGHGVFALPESVAVEDPAGALTTLYAGGVRSLLLHGGGELAQPYLELQLIDTVDVFIPPSALSAPEQVLTPLPAGFGIRNVTHLDSGLIVQATYLPFATASMRA
jgi:diaminohydroxyphosphoribosylaminopyrimidine deaminase/5-amino-6-(5-phosphoribosylamino)uracil reductase